MWNHTDTFAVVRSEFLDIDIDFERTAQMMQTRQKSFEIQKEIACS